VEDTGESLLVCGSVTSQYEYSWREVNWQIKML
jgi:hypothetical protein